LRVWEFSGFEGDWECRKKNEDRVYIGKLRAEISGRPAEFPELEKSIKRDCGVRLHVIPPHGGYQTELKEPCGRSRVNVYLLS
jgi:hypothetical protein